MLGGGLAAADGADLGGYRGFSQEIDTQVLKSDASQNKKNARV